MKKKDQVTAAEEQKEAVQGKGKKRRAREAQREIRWDRLDNTAHLFPVIAGESMSNVYRISVTLTELVDRELLQQALDMVLPKFDGFNLRLRQGVFWYYFEENGKPAPRVREESAFPCRYIRQNKNHSYMFRVTYYKYRINLEVFHVLTDGMGGINFLKELTYQYLRLAHPKLREKVGDSLSSDTSLNREDSFLKNYKHSSQKGYQTKRAYLLKGEKLPPGEFGVMHGYMKIPELKKVCHAYGVSINEYLVAVYVWSVYTECMHGMPSERPVRVAVPVNLRPYFNSITTKNFFVMVSAEFHPTKEIYTFEEVLKSVSESLRSQIGLVLQEPFLFSQTIRENIAATRPGAPQEELRSAAAIACVDEAICEFPEGYETLVGERGVTLSGGQKQRVAIARMLMQRAPIMVFDDSLSAVDAETDAKIRAALHESLGKATVLLISHRVTTLMQADCILVLDGGRVSELGTHAELIAKPGIYRDIYDIQMSSDDRRLLGKEGV